MARKLSIKKYPLLVLFLACLSTMIWGTANAQAAEGIEASLNFDGRQITVGDLVPLSLTVRHPARYRMLAPSGDEIQNPFEWRGALPPEVHSQPDGSEVSTQTIQVTLWAPGDYTLSPIPVRVIDTAGNVYTVETDPLDLRVDSVLIAGDTSLRDIKQQASLPMPLIWPWVIAGLLVLTSTVILIWRWFRRRKTLAAVMDFRSIDQIALDELKRIEGLALPSKGRLKDHYTLSTDVLRQYLDKGFNIPALDQTTSEIRHALNRSRLPSDVSLEFVRLLTSADLVKFAKYLPEGSEINSYIPRIRQLIIETKVEEQAQ